MSETDRSGRPRLPVRLFARGSWSETRRVITILHKETVGGALLLCASPQAAYTVVNGRVVVREGQLATLDLGPLLERHNRKAEELTRAAGVTG